MRDVDRRAPSQLDAERGDDGTYAVAPEPTWWQDLGWCGILCVSVGALGMAWPFIGLAVWLVGD